MKLEVIKSYTLAILVGISLILSFSLWSYQPKEDDEKSILDEKEELLNEEQINLGGTEETKKSLVQPTQLIFEQDNNYYGFSNAVNRQNLYEDMTSWVLYNFRISDANGRPNVNRQVEIIYPDELPMNIIPNLFTVNNSEQVYNLAENFSFQRLYITFKSVHSLTFNFLSTDGKTQISADVNNAQKHDQLLNYLTTLEGLEKYVMLEEKEFPIYLPVNPIQAIGYKGSMSKLDPEILKNALFQDPLEVHSNVSDDMEIWYQDSVRLMQVFEDRLNMTFIHPQETLSYNPITFIELLDQSIATINGYKGWVQDYNLESINTMNIRYQMYYRGYPVFNHEGLSIIEQKWVNKELEEHRQPLFKIINTVPEPYTLDPGKDIISYIKESSNYKISEIEDIQVGFRLGYSIETEEFIRLSLTPDWYVKINGQWEPIVMDEEHRKGVS